MARLGERRGPVPVNAMRVLVIDEWVPLPLDSGKKIRTFHLLAPLAKRHEITYLCYADAKRHAENIYEMQAAGFRVLPVKPVKRFCTPITLALGVAGNLLSRTPLVVRKHLSRRFMSRLRKLLNTEVFDVLHCEWTHYAQYLRRAAGLPRFLASHNVESIQWSRFAQVQRNLCRRAAIWLEWRKMRCFEGRSLRIFDHIAAVSGHDAELMKSRFGAKSVDVIPNGVDVAYYERAPRREEPDLLVYCASMDSWVNQDAAFYFVRDILPRIHERRPQSRFMIVGRNPPQGIRDLATDRVLVTGTVADIRPVLARAAVSVVPLRIASGSRLKILESLAAGVPVVSSAAGAEGLELKYGSELLVADSDAEFAAQCVRLLDDAPLRRRLANAGQALVRQKYDWSALFPLVEKAWTRTIENFRRRSDGPFAVSSWGANRDGMKPVRES
jgi:glycosyltransferase involved in cell wall biosynthesis